MVGCPRGGRIISTRMPRSSSLSAARSGSAPRPTLNAARAAPWDASTHRATGHGEHVNEGRTADKLQELRRAERLRPADLINLNQFLRQSRLSTGGLLPPVSAGAVVPSCGQHGINHQNPVDWGHHIIWGSFLTLNTTYRLREMTRRTTKPRRVT